MALYPAPSRRSDVLRPESTPVLNQMQPTMSRYEDLSIVIEGHTDATGDDAHDQNLSERRARSVVDWLAAQGIDVLGDNAAPEGRQENRRVAIRSDG